MMSEEQFQQYLNRVEEKEAASQQDNEALYNKTLQAFESRLQTLATNTDEAISKGLTSFSTRLDGLAKKMDKVIEDNNQHKDEVKNEFVIVKNQVSSLQAAVTEYKDKFETRLTEFEENLNKLADTVHSSPSLST